MTSVFQPLDLEALQSIYCLCGLENNITSRIEHPAYYDIGVMHTLPSPVPNPAERINCYSYDFSAGNPEIGAMMGVSAENYMVNKDEMYFKLLDGYKYETISFYDEYKQKEIVEYRCGYPKCGKTLQKPWNLLDHVRMHEGVKPFKCQWCGKGFTQKGNLKKHARQHINPDVNARKRYN